MASILHVVESTATGTLSVLVLMANEQARQGHDIEVAFSRRKETPEKLDQMFHNGVSLVPVPLPGAFGVGGIFKLRSILRQSKPDVVVCHSSVAGFLGRLAGIGLSGNYYYLPHCIATLRRDISFWKKVGVSTAEKLAAVKRAAYVAVSKSEQTEIRRQIPYRKCLLLENAVDTDFWMSERPWEDRLARVLTVGHIRKQKGPLKFVELARHANDQGIPLDFIWVGDGDEKLKRELEGAGVRVTGWKSPAEIRGILAESKYFVSTSEWEGMPVAAIEAMATGCIPLLSRCEGNIDVVEHERTGYLFDETQVALNILKDLESRTPVGRGISKQVRIRSVQRFGLSSYRRNLANVIR